MPSVVERVQLPDGRVRERKAGSRYWFYYYPKCQTCGWPKGKSGQPDCMKCRHGDRKGILLDCPHCKGRLARADIVVAMYNAGVPMTEIASVFHISKTTVANTVRKWSKSKAPEITIK